MYNEIDNEEIRKLETTICIVGGGPSGLLLGLLLAKQGLEVTVLESQADFERKFRGEVLQPRFIRLMKQLNLDKYLEQFEHKKLSSGEIWSEDRLLANIDYSKDTPEAPYSIRMKQSVLLQALYKLAVSYPNFHMYFKAKMKSLVKKKNVYGVLAIIDKQEVEINAKLIVGADGRFSTVKKHLDMTYKYKTDDFDMIWFTVPSKYIKNADIFFRVTNYSNYIVIPGADDTLQIGFTMKKGQWAKTKEKGIQDLSNEWINIFPDLKEYLLQLEDFRTFVCVKSELYFVNQWYKNGCVLIGDAAHCSSPVGAIGISLAAETAVTLAGLICKSITSSDFHFNELKDLEVLRGKEIRIVHCMQKVLTSAIIKSPKWSKKYIISITPLLSKTKPFRAAKRRFLLGNAVLIHPDLVFTDNDFCYNI